MDPWAMLHHPDPTNFHISEPVSMLRRILSSSFDCSIGFIDLLYTSFSWFYGLGQERKIAKPVLSPLWSWSYFFLLYCLCCFGWFVRALYIFFFSFIFISWRLITSQHFSGFCHTLTWVSHGVTCIPHPDLPSHLPLHPIPLGLPSAPGPSTCLMHPTWAGDLFH